MREYRGNLSGLCRRPLQENRGFELDWAKFLGALDCKYFFDVPGLSAVCPPSHICFLLGQGEILEKFGLDEALRLSKKLSKTRCYRMLRMLQIVGSTKG